MKTITLDYSQAVSLRRLYRNEMKYHTERKDDMEYVRVGKGFELRVHSIGVTYKYLGYGVSIPKDADRRFNHEIYPISISDALSEKRKKSRAPQNTQIIGMFKDDNLVKEFNSVANASKDTLINKGSIRHCLNGKRRTAGGYNWRYL